MNNNFIGKNSLENIKILMKEKKIEKILIFAGKNSYNLSGVKEQLKIILEKKNYKIIFKKAKLPIISDLEYFVSELKKFKPEIIVSIGGGAVLDLSKITNCLYDHNDIKTSIINNKYKIKKKYCSLIAVPTTAGSGAEATSNAVIYINKVKYSIEGSLIRPDYVFVDPELILTAPKNIAAAAGMDAIAQGIESLISKKSNDESKEFSKLSLQDSLRYFENHINKKNFETSYKMASAAFNAGKAINISKTTAPHALSYPFSSYFGIQHGHAVSLTLTDFLKFNYNNIHLAKVNFNLDDRYKIIFNLFKVKNILELSNKIENIIKKVGLELNFKKLKIDNNSQIDIVLKNINLQRLANNPITLDLKSIEKILRSKI